MDDASHLRDAMRDAARAEGRALSALDLAPAGFKLLDAGSYESLLGVVERQTKLREERKKTHPEIFATKDRHSKAWGAESAAAARRADDEGLFEIQDGER